MEIAYIPSPSRGMIELGPIPLRGYAFCIILGVFVAIWLGNRRWIARGGQKGTVADIAVWAVPFGLVGGRLYHVITSYELYFGEGRDPVDAVKIWEGGLGIWGAIAFGAVGAWIGCRRRGIPLPAWADALAPGLALAQAVGRWGNWFNQELYGKPTDLPWAVKISEEHRPADRLDVATYHPTFLYEFLWCVGVALLVIWADRKFRLGHGRAFAVYVAAYTVGRFWIEYLRIDDAHHLWGLRLNGWTSIVVFVGAVAYLVISAKKRPGREDVVEPAAVSDAAVSDEKPDDVKPEGENTDGEEPEGEESTEPVSVTKAEKTPDATEGDPDPQPKAGATADPDPQPEAGVTAAPDPEPKAEETPEPEPEPAPEPDASQPSGKRS